MVDKDGNRYFIDKNGKIWTTGKPEYDYKPVSIDGLDYYVNHGIELIKGHYKLEGITVLKSILAMPASNNLIYNAQVKAAKEINRLIKLEGDRFYRLSRKASVILYRIQSDITIMDDYMGFSINVPFRCKIIKRRIRERHDYLNHGISIGVITDESKSEKGKYEKYDALIAIDSERFKIEIPSVERLKKNWILNYGEDKLLRKELYRDTSRIIYEFENKLPELYRGFEGIFMKGKYGHIIRIITSDNIYNKYRDQFYTIVKNFKM